MKNNNPNFIKMKTILKTVFVLLTISLASGLDSNGQIKVSSNNYVGINYEGVPLSRFVINSAGDASYQAYIYNSVSASGAALAAMSDKGISGSYHIKGLHSQTYIGSGNFFYGAAGYAINSSETSTGRAYGLYGMAGNATSGYNYGVYGYLYGSQNGAAVFGTINGLGDIQVSGKFAGYFRGNVKCENIVYAASFQTQSDEKLKTNISKIDTEEIINRINKLNPVKYYLKQIDIIQESGDTTSVAKLFNEKDQLFTKAKYGVIAQELKECFPELVYEDDEGNYTVDYIGLIPIMIKMIQSQQSKIESCEERITSLSKEVAVLKQKNNIN